MIRTPYISALLAGLVAVPALVGANEAAEVRKATFEARHELKVTVPEGAKSLHIWFTRPQDDVSEQISDFRVESPYPTRTEVDSEGNKVLYLEVENPTVKEFTIVETFVVTRRELGSILDPANAVRLSPEDRKDYARFLGSNANIVIDDRIRDLSNQIVGGEKNPVVQARKIFDWVLNNVDYWVKDPKNKKASPVGSNLYCLENKCGNCSDFHSLWVSLARSAGIPCRMVFGSYFKSSLDGADKDQSYHCWVEYHVKNIGWIPLDVSAADMFCADIPLNDDNRSLVNLATPSGYHGAEPEKVDYYFSRIEERRVTWSRGRDLILSPKPAAVTPLNALIKAYVEADGQPLEERQGWERKLTYKERKP